MPRIRQKADVYRNEDFRRDVLARLAQMGIHQRDLAEHLGVCDGTISIMLRQPEKISVDRLRKIISFLDLEPASILRFTGYNQRDIKKEENRNASK